MAVNVSLATLSTLNNQSILTQSNSNFTAIQTALQNALSLNGQSPNQMKSVLDMNGNQVINLPPPGTINSPARVVDVVTNPTIVLPPTGTSGAVVGFLNGNNTYSGSSTFTGTVTLTGSNLTVTGGIPNSDLAPMAANTIKANVTSGSAVPTDWAIGASSNVEATGVPGFDGTQFFIYHAPASASTPQPTTLRVDRNANYTGGTLGNVYNSIWANSTVGANVTNNEWALLAELTNSATGGTGNVALQGTAFVQTSTTAITWGSNFTVDDRSGIANPTAGRVGCEIDNYGNGTDTNSQRIILDLVGGKHGGTGTTPTITWGWRVGAQNGTLANATFVHGGYFNTATYTDLINASAGVVTTNGIDFSNAAFSGAPFKSTGFSVSAAGLVTASSVVIPATGTISLNGTTSMDGTFSTAAVAPVLTANKPGSSTAIGTWLKVLINGITFWVPAWNN